MSSAAAEPTVQPKHPERFRRLVLLGVIVVVFLAGLGMGAFLEEVSLPLVKVSPSLVIVGPDAQNVSSSPCADGSETSFDGYFECPATLWCDPWGDGGGFSIQNASAPGAANLVLTPPLPRYVACDSSQNLQISGQLGYSGSVTIYLGVV